MSNRDVFSQRRKFQSENVNPTNVKKADLIVGIPSYNEADNIAFVTGICNEGIQKYFPKCQSVIMNVDNNSPDDTRTAFLNAKTTVPKIYISTPSGIKGKGNNFFNLFCEAKKLGAKTIVVVDADLKSITPEWVRDLALPIMDRYHFVTPLYSRNEYDGTITNTICYPLIHGLLGRDIRQPIGGEFAFSGKYVDYILSQPWHETTRQYGIDIFMTLNAILGGFEICKVGLGAKIHKPSAPKLGPMFTQVVDTLFKTLIANKSHWFSINGVEELPLHGKVEFSQPQSLSVDYKEMKATAQCGFSISQETLATTLEPSIYEKLALMYKKGRITIGINLWARIVYDFVYAYEFDGKNSYLVEALKPLYFGRVISFIRKTLDMDYISSENEIQRQAKHFYKMRSSLIRKYRKKEVA
jgi:glycosyltransferase involved in cell wall biosynthesis